MGMILLEDSALTIREGRHHVARTALARPDGRTLLSHNPGLRCLSEAEPTQIALDCLYSVDAPPRREHDVRTSVHAFSGPLRAGPSQPAVGHGPPPPGGASEDALTAT
jgi:hypothetical protein